MHAKGFLSFFVPVMIIASAGCDNVEFGGFQLELQAPAPAEGMPAQIELPDSVPVPLTPIETGPVVYLVERGEIIVIMDSDGQNDPADIPALLAAMTPDVDCCCGIRGKRHDTFSKRWASKIGNGVRKLITGGTVTDAGCAFKGVRRHALAEIPVFNGMHRWLATMLEHQGYTVTEIPINHRAREHGVSAYTNLDRALRGLPDCLAMRWYRKRAVRGDRWTPDQD
jgi:hypothetical protein